MIQVYVQGKDLPILVPCPDDAHGADASARRQARISFDLVGLLHYLSGKQGWEEVNGPDSRCGLDYWYRAGDSEAWANIDQTWITVWIDEQQVYSGDYEEDVAVRR